MALTASNVVQDIVLSGGNRIADGQLTFDNAYPAGGYPGIASLLGFRTLRMLIASNRSGYDVEYVRATDKLKVSFGTGTSLSGPHTELANNSAALNALTVDFLAIGTI